ncbi:MAG: 6,7-dimethyl-8-ribityllumazine synthase [Bacteroidales bacterium]|nr:6,7-dimethyl-8-ribityllumazine synthase [Bacteroidales bacterium]
MASKLKNLSQYDPESVPSAADMKFAIVVSEWNHNVTGALLEGALETLKKHGASEDNIIVRYVPGSFELIASGKWMAEYTDADAILLFGCVIKGDTPHFDYVCQGTTQGIAQLNVDYDVPFIFGLLTTNDLQQALDRCGGKLGNKGTECAVTAIKMAALQKDLIGEMADEE